jgi:two-component system chemotaxis response regulator CheY
MNRILILCVEDEPEVRDALLRDLAPFNKLFVVEAAEDVEDARTVLREAEERGDRPGLVLCDHLLPGQSGTEFLVELNRQERTRAVRKVLLTGQADLADTIKAINEADLDHYIAKPWAAADLHAAVKRQLTEFVLGQDEDLLPYVPVLDGPRLLDALGDRASDR